MSLGLLLGAVAAAGAETGAGGFTFSPPPGWIDISRGAPEAQRQKAPPALLAQADNPGSVVPSPRERGDAAWSRT